MFGSVSYNVFPIETSYFPGESVDFSYPPCFQIEYKIAGKLH